MIDKAPRGVLVPVAALAVALSTVVSGCGAATTPGSAAGPVLAPQGAAVAGVDGSGPATPDGAQSPVADDDASGDRPVLVVKLDNTRQAQPHAGLQAADVVYVEEVEYGLTRLAAVYSSRLPREVGPVRSARISDIDLFAAYGRPAFAYSGAQRRLLPRLGESALVEVSPAEASGAYWREAGRRAPYNLFADPRELLGAAGDRVSPAGDVGFVFSEEPPAGGDPGRSVTAAWPDSTIAFRYDADADAYAVHLDGSPARAAEGGGQRASTVVIQYVKQTESGFKDRYGGRTPLVDTVGEGSAVVLRNGRAYRATWSRPGAEDGTTFTGPDGQPLPFEPGQQWVVLVDRTNPVEIR